MTITILKPGDTAPDFTLEDVLGRTVSLKEYAAKHKVLLVFLRYAGCPFCNLTIHRLTIENPILEQSGCKVITFIQSPPESIIDNVYGTHAKTPPFPIIADPSMSQYKKYGVGTSLKASIKSIRDIPHWVRSVSKHGYSQKKIDGNLFLVPAMFVIEKSSQVIIDAKYQQSFYDHATFTNIYESLVFEA